MDRLGRSLCSVIRTVEQLTAVWVLLRSLGEGIDYSTPTGRMLAGIIAALAEYERELMHERAAAARQAARLRGRRTGRSPRLSPAQTRQVRALRGWRVDQRPGPDLRGLLDSHHLRRGHPVPHRPGPACGVPWSTTSLLGQTLCWCSGRTTPCSPGTTSAGCVVHSDRGSQFRSRKVLAELRRHDLAGSMGQVASAGDNAAMESFFSLLQKNVLDRRRSTRQQLRLAIITWIERTYHRRRRQPGSVDSLPSNTSA